MSATEGDHVDDGATHTDIVDALPVVEGLFDRGETGLLIVVVFCRRMRSAI
jgi:hypothetical protein